MTSLAEAARALLEWFDDMSLPYEKRREHGQPLADALRAALDAPPNPSAEPTQEERRRVAMLTGHDPDQPETWHLGMIDRLIAIEKRDGDKAFYREIERLMTPPPHTSGDSAERARAIVEEWDKKFRPPLTITHLAMLGLQDIITTELNASTAALREEVARLQRELIQMTDRWNAQATATTEAVEAMRERAAQLCNKKAAMASGVTEGSAAIIECAELLATSIRALTPHTGTQDDE